MKKLVIGLVFLAVAGAKVALKTGLGVGLVTTAEVEASKHMAWPKEFRQAFFGGCIGEFKDNRKLGDAYCGCYVDGIEKAKVIETKYNSLTTTEDEYTNNLIEAVDKYVRSSDGEKLLKGCVETAELAVAKNKRKPSQK